ncbi:uncharacterized protein [Henckelia pumila]|uniref:uncharacterized protein n=1 Tax=Henckelia pumila TaxID=405737 RepID=UPI003C6E5FA4
MMSIPQQKIETSDDLDFSDTQLSDLDQSDMESSDMEFSHREFTESKPLAIAEAYRSILLDLRELCDFCMEPPDDDGETVDAGITYVNADKKDNLRDLAELALKFYNDTKAKNFKLVKVCKINYGSTYFGVTFRAQEGGSEECPLFRGAIHCVGGDKPAFCEIKDNEEVTLLPSDDNYVSSQGSCESKDGSPFKWKTDRGDGSPANTEDGSIAGSDVSGGSSN